MVRCTSAHTLNIHTVSPLQGWLCLHTHLALPVGGVPELDGAVIGAGREPALAVGQRVHDVGVVVQRPHHAPRVRVPHLQSPFAIRA